MGSWGGWGSRETLSILLGARSVLGLAVTASLLILGRAILRSTAEEASDADGKRERRKQRTHVSWQSRALRIKHRDDLVCSLSHFLSQPPVCLPGGENNKHLFGNCTIRHMAAARAGSMGMAAARLSPSIKSPDCWKR